VTFSDVARAAAALISVGTVVISVVFARAGRMAAPGPSFYSQLDGLRLSNCHRRGRCVYLLSCCRRLLGRITYIDTGVDFSIDSPAPIFVVLRLDLADELADVAAGQLARAGSSPSRTKCWNVLAARATAVAESYAIKSEVVIAAFGCPETWAP
jgi:hypothetical protein